MGFQMNPQNLSMTTDGSPNIVSDAEDPVSRIDVNASLPVEQYELDNPTLIQVASVGNYRPNPGSLRVGPKDKPFTAEQCDLTLKVIRELVDMYNGTELADYLSVNYIGRIYH